MKSLSSIIKGGRIRNQTVINLSERLSIPPVECEPTDFQVDEVTPDSFEQEQMDLVQLKIQQLLEEAQKTADGLIKAAQEEAQDIQEKAKHRSQSLLEEASNKQYNILEKAHKTSAQIIEDAYKEKAHIIKNIEGELTETLITLLQYLVGEEVYHNTSWVLCVVRRMLAHDNFKKNIRIFLSEATYNRLTADEKEKLLALKEEVSLHISETLSNTECKVETDEGAIEYDVAAGLDRVISDVRILRDLNEENYD